MSQNLVWIPRVGPFLETTVGNVSDPVRIVQLDNPPGFKAESPKVGPRMRLIALGMVVAFITGLAAGLVAIM